MIHQPKYDGLTRLTAAEFEGMTALQMDAFKPGLLSLTNANLARATKSGAVVTCGDFTAGDAIVTGGALCLAWLVRTFDFATAGDGGGPMPAGTYTIYLRLQEYGAGARSMRCYPSATTEAEVYGVDDAGDPDAWRVGTVDRDVYLVVAENVVWNGVDTLTPSTPPDSRTDAWGAIDLARLGRGTHGEIVIEDRALSFENLDLTTLDVTVLDLDGILYVSDGSDVWAWNSYWHFRSGTDFVCEDGPFLMDLGMAATLRIGGGVIENDGDIEMGSASQIVMNTGSSIIGSPGSYFMLPMTPAATNPIANEATGKHLSRAWALVADDGTLVDGLNVASVTKTGTGEYRVNFGRALTGLNYGGVATVQGIGDYSAVVAPVSSSYATVRTMNAGFDADAKFLVSFYGETIS